MVRETLAAWQRGTRETDLSARAGGRSGWTCPGRGEAVECQNGPPVAARQRGGTAVVAQAVRRKRRGLLSAKLALPGPQRGQALSRCTSWPLRDAWFFSLLIIAFSTSSRFMCPA